jgi:hypothetical protein
VEIVLTALHVGDWTAVAPRQEKKVRIKKDEVRTGGKLERYQAKIGVPPNSWRTRFTPLGEASYFAIFSAAAR